ncbi:MAG: J domain-containing protein [Xanthobacteraceae bacterium]
MLDRLGSTDFSSLLSHVALLASWNILPLLLLAYGRQLLLARRMSPEFSLRRSEVAELGRAVSLYRTVCSRLRQIDERCRKTNSIWAGIFALQLEADGRGEGESEDLKAHAHHLQATILRLRSLPLKRLRLWIHIMSLRAALGRALAAHAGVFAILVVAIHLFQQTASARELLEIIQRPFVWYPLDKSLLPANAAGAGLAVLVMPVSYLLRRAGLRREFGVEFRMLKQLAATPPGLDVACPDADPDGEFYEESASAEHGADPFWFTTLGVAPSATIDEVRQAYKTLIRQCHPDRVHDMSPAIKDVAETEAKRVNAAYEQALASLT